MAQVRAHIAALNEHFSKHTTPIFRRFALDEDTVTFKVSVGAATGEVSLSLSNLPSYPRTGGFVFADGSDELVTAVEAIGPSLSDDASLDRCLRALVAAVPAVDVGLRDQLVDLPSGRAAGAAGSSSADGLSSEPRIAHNSSATDGDDDDMEEEEDDEMEDEDEDLQANLDYDFAKGAELENTLLRLRHKWELTDQKRREESERAKVEEDLAAAAVMGAKRKRPDTKKPPQKQGAHQIFSSAEATRMLCNELFDLMKEEREGFEGVSADCVDYNIHQWRVQVSDITPESNLKVDLVKMQELYGYSDLQLELSFIPDMHPFYPVFVKVLRPRFIGVTAEAVMTHPAMTLQGWDPMKRVKWLVRLVQTFLEQHGRVDIDDERNDPERHPEGAYSPAEFAICRLELLAGVAPVWAASEPELLASRNAEVDLDRIRELNFGKKQKAESSGPWASGVGYGHSGTEGGHQWDIAATEKAQAQADIEMRQMLELVAQCVARGELQPLTLEKSCLRPLLWRQLHTASLLDVGTRPERTSMYIQMLEVLRAVAAWPRLQAVLSTPTSTGSGCGSVFTELESVRRQAEFFLRTTSKSAAKDDSELEGTVALAETIIKTASEVAQCAPPTASEVVQSAPSTATAAPSPTGAAAASSAAARSDAGAASKPQSGTPRTTRQAAAAAAASAVVPVAAAVKASAKASAKATAPSDEPASDSVYESTMRTLSFDACEGIRDHYYETRSEGREAAATQLVARSRRLAMEAADMMGGALPVAPSSSVWVRVNENQMQFWRAMISGPEGTPYSGGCFVFDILCPSEYPNVAPKVHLLTTGGGSVRFNPNLYNCGKVCLSLLGTWHGDHGESWHAKTSTLLQVLMSIQALILVPDPFFNEPGYERNRGTPEGDRQNRQYNETIREGTVRYAMIDILAKPPDAFAASICAHFRLRKVQIIEQVRSWAADKGNSTRHAETMKALASQLEAAIAKHAIETTE